MTTYTFAPQSATQTSTYAEWDDPTIWDIGSVPNGPTADVVLPVITNGYTNEQQSFLVTLPSSDTYQIKSLNNTGQTVSINGNLTVIQPLHTGNMQILGALSASYLYIDELGSSGAINANNIEIDGTLGLVSGDVTSNSMTNNGFIDADGLATINVSPGGFTNLIDGTITGGRYRSLTYPQAANNGAANLRFNVGELIATDAANIELDGGGTIESYDTTTQQFVPITTSLHDITSSGLLTIAGNYNFSELHVSGQLILSSYFIHYYVTPTLTANLLSVNTGGIIHGQGIIGSAVTNNGTLKVDATINNGELEGNPQLTLEGAVSGQGTIEISASPKSTVEIAGAVAAAQTVKFDTNVGQLRLDQPSTFAGLIAPTGSGDTILLPGLSANAAKSYAGDTSSGILTIQGPNGPISLRFAGNYEASSFAFSAGPQVYSSDPPSLLITISAPAVQPTAPTPAQPASSAPTVSSEVGLLYETILNRGADPQGLATSVGQVAQGISLASEAGAIVASSEAQALYGSQTDTQFVAQLFSNAYGTAAASAGNLAEAVRLVGRLDAGTLSRADVAAGVALGSPHLRAAGVTLPGGLIDPALTGTVTTNPHSAGGTADLVALTLLGTNPTGLDLETGAQALSHGASARDVAGQFLSGSASTLAGLSDTQFIDQLYQNSFARTPDAGGVATYQAALASGTSRAAVTADVALSQEHINDVQGAFSQGVYVPSASSSALARLYHGILGRAPDIWGLLSDSHLPQDASTLSNRAGAMLGSTEYASRFGQMSDTAFVSSLYQNALGRTPDAGGLSTYTGLLAGGTSRATVALDISESQEATRHLAPQIENGFRFT